MGIRNVSSTARGGYNDARKTGSDILSVREQRKLGAEATIARIPDGARRYITIDIDAFCPSIAPGTGTPSHAGFLYYEVLEMMQAAAKRHQILGIDLVEVAPDFDPTGSTGILAAQLLLNTLGFIFHERRARSAERLNNQQRGCPMNLMNFYRSIKLDPYPCTWNAGRLARRG